MKKIISVLFSLCLFMFSANAAVYTQVDTATLKRVLDICFETTENKAAAAKVYLDSVTQNGGAGINASQIHDMCVAGGAQPGGDACNKLIIGLSNVYKRPCTKNDAGECIRDFKSIQTQPRGGKNFAEGYMNYRRSSPNIVCAADKSFIVTSGNDDYIPCRSLDKLGTYFEFQFDDLSESSDDTTASDNKNAIAIIAGYADNDDLHDKTFVQRQNIDSAKCGRVNNIAKDFGYAAQQMLDDSLYKPGNYCGLKVNKTQKIVNQYAGKIDNYVYSSNNAETQVQAAASLDESIELYVKSKLGAANVTSFECDKAHWRYHRGVFEDSEDVLTCRINGKRVDFVFDDLTQATALWGGKIIAGSQQGMGCIASGGTFDGERCADLTEELCKEVAKLSAKDCPGCQAAYWDGKNKICALPASAAAKNVKTAIRVTTRVGAAVGVLAITVASGGGAVVIIASATATAAAGVSEGAKLVLDSKSDDWIIEMNQITTSQAADKFLRTHLNEIIGAKDLDPARISALDTMLSKTLSKTSDSYFAEIVANCQRITEHKNVKDGDENLGDAVSIVYDTSLPSCALNPNNGKNNIQTLINTADFVELVAGIVAIVGGLAQTSKVVTQRVTNVTKAIEEYKTTGWIRASNGKGWLNQTTGEWAKTLPDGVPGWNPHPNLSGGGRWHGHLYGRGTTGSFTKSKDITRFFTERSVKDVVSRVWNPNWRAVAGSAYYVADGTVNLLDNNQHDIKIPERISKVNPTPVEEVVNTPTPVNVIKDVVDPLPRGDVPNAVVVTPPESTNLVSNSEPNNKSIVPVMSETNTEKNSRDVKPFNVKKGSNTALIATAAVAGIVGTGFLIGSLVGQDDDNDDNKNTVVATPGSDMTASLNTLMQNANGTFGFINSDGLSLVSLPTTVGTYVPIVLINNKAVAVVKYREHKFPFWVNPSSGLWEPLLGIGNIGGWFNAYPNSSSSGIEYIDSITNQMNVALTPRTVLYFTAPNDSGAQFPTASSNAFDYINAEFPNGVVQSYGSNGLSPSDTLLYNNNYNRIKTMF